MVRGTVHANLWEDGTTWVQTAALADALVTHIIQAILYTVVCAERQQSTHTTAGALTTNSNLAKATHSMAVDSHDYTFKVLLVGDSGTCADLKAPHVGIHRPHTDNRLGPHSQAWAKAAS